MATGPRRRAMPGTCRLLASVHILNAVSLIFERAAIGTIERLPAVVLALILTRRNCGRCHKAVAATTVIIESHDLSRVIDSDRKCASGGAGVVEIGKRAVAFTQKAVADTAAIEVVPHDLPGVIDSPCSRSLGTGAGVVEIRKGAAIATPQKAVEFAAAGVISRYLSGTVDSIGRCLLLAAAGVVEASKGAAIASEQKAVNSIIGVIESGYLPRVVDSVRNRAKPSPLETPKALGSSTLVKVPPSLLRRNPDPAASNGYDPTICPVSLIPCANVNPELPG